MEGKLFQQDDATCHTPQLPIDGLLENCRGSIMSNYDEINWLFATIGFLFVSFLKSANVCLHD